MALWNVLSQLAKAAVGGRIFRVAVTDRAIDILGGWIETGRQL